MKKAFDLIVVGAGILGLSSAIHAARRGLSVLLLEQDASPFGATRRNFGMVGVSTLAHPDSVWRRYALDSVAFYQDLQTQADISFTRRSGLYLANTSAELTVLKEFSHLSLRHGIPSEFLDIDALKQRHPYLNDTFFLGGLHLSEDYSVEPSRIGSALLAHAQDHNLIHVITKACVVSVVSHAEDVTITCADGSRHSAGKALICHGNVTDILYPNVLRAAGLKRCKLQMAATAPLAQRIEPSLYSGLSLRRYPAFEICPGFSDLMKTPVDTRVENHGIHVLIKQAGDGSLIIGDTHDYSPIDELMDLGQREELNRFIEDYVRCTFSMELPPIAKRWNGYYLNHPEHAAFSAEPEPNVHIISAIGGKGMTTGPGFTREYIENLFA